MDKKIAPHEGRELELVLTGKKHFAVVEQDKDPVQFGMIMTDKNLEVRAQKEGGSNVVRFWLKGSEDGGLANFMYMQLTLNAARLIADNGLHWYQREMGRIFGYTEEEIEAFIKGDIECNCKNCKGISNNGF